MRRLLCIAATGLLLTACTTPTAMEPPPATAPEASLEQAPKLNEQDALRALAAVNPDLTNQEWRSISNTICEMITANQHPLDQPGDPIIQTATDLWDTPTIQGTTSTPAQLATNTLNEAQMITLVIGATQLECPEYQDQIPAAVDYFNG